jgi:hypothetical protein
MTIDQTDTKAWQQVSIDDLREALTHTYKLVAFLHSIGSIVDNDLDQADNGINAIYWLAHDGSSKCLLIMDALGKVIDDIGASRPPSPQ